ncbi:terminal oxidase subunit I [Citrobacter koseri]|uniref:Terminal oxidase subunit I n=1 Tax=Citrobacter koseri TaxID=545 RepID=A0A2X2VNY4_CITKO|nr:terminal oxidase subunit I [Citrobacter koseri]
MPLPYLFTFFFPAITIGLASFLAVLEGLWLKTKNETYRDLYHFWSKIFAVNFGMGVVSGLVMAYQFGTNWSGFSQFAGSITGPLLTYEVLTAFFLEGGLSGRDAVRLEARRAGAAFLRDLHGCAGNLVFNVLDPLFQ